MNKLIAAWCLLLIGGLLLLLGAVNLYQAQHGNRLIARLAGGEELSLVDLRNAVPEVRLARALQLQRQQRYDDALATMSLIIGSGNKALQTQIRYNLGNLYLQRAIAEIDAMAVNDALPLLALAKQAYRQALALDSGFWDAKYNLDVAMRLLPEMDRINIEEEPTPTQKNQLWTTVPGFPRGLP